MPEEESVLLGGRSVRRMGFGAMQLPGPGVFGPPKDRDIALRVLRRVVDAGVNHIDTAQFYGPDVANELLREALYPYPDESPQSSAVPDRQGTFRQVHENAPKSVPWTTRLAAVPPKTLRLL